MYQQIYNGIRVEGASIGIHVDKEGNIRYVNGHRIIKPRSQVALYIITNTVQNHATLTSPLPIPEPAKRRSPKPKVIRDHIIFDASIAQQPAFALDQVQITFLSWQQV
jgi:hypothetical protein